MAKSSKKTIFIFDTNVLISDPMAIYKYGNADVVIPFKVLEELDKNKVGLGSVKSYNARSAIRELEKLREKGDLSKGVNLGEGLGLLKIRDDDDFNNEVADNKIINIAILERNENKKKNVVMISNDVAVRVKANSLGLEARAHDENVEMEKEEGLYSGLETILVSDQEIDNFYIGQDVILENKANKLFPNGYILLTSNIDSKKTALARYVEDGKPLKKVKDIKNGIFGMKARSKEQRCAFDAVVDTEIPLVSLIGSAGTGKSMLALACGLQMTLEKPVYKKLVIIKPTISVGKELGFMPGDANEKMSNWMGSILDNIQVLLKNDRITLDELLHQGMIEIAPMSFIRGRSITNAFVIIDEIQSLTLHEVKTLLTRAGNDSKFVVTGDLHQIDTPNLSEATSGLSVLVEKMKDQKVSAHITLIKGERSELASVIAKVL